MYLTADRLAPFKGKSDKSTETTPFKAGSDILYPLYGFGSFAAIILGCGMSLIMTDINVFLGITNPLVPGIIIGVIGLFFAIINYPVYKRILASRRKKYASKIIELSDKITKAYEQKKD